MSFGTLSWRFGSRLAPNSREVTDRLDALLAIPLPANRSPTKTYSANSSEPQAPDP